MPIILKIWLLVIIASIFLLNELGVILVDVPQIKKQIPATWVRNTPLHNMMIWGSSLGAGIFTYNPHATFYILYLYIGFFKQPYIGLVGGLMYGVSRWIPTVLIAGIRNFKARKPYNLNMIYTKKAWAHLLHTFSLILFIGYLMYQL